MTNENITLEANVDEYIVSDEAQEIAVNAEIRNANRAAGNYAEYIGGEHVIFKNGKIVYISSLKYKLVYSDDSALGGRKRFYTNNFLNGREDKVYERKVIGRNKIAELYMIREQTKAQEKMFIDFINAVPDNGKLFEVWASVTFADGNNHDFKCTFGFFEHAKKFAADIKNLAADELLDHRVRIKRPGALGHVFYYFSTATNSPAVYYYGRQYGFEYVHGNYYYNLNEPVNADDDDTDVFDLFPEVSELNDVDIEETKNDTSDEPAPDASEPTDVEAEPEFDEDAAAEKFIADTEWTYHRMIEAVEPAHKFLRDKIFYIYHFDYTLTVRNQRGEIKAHPNKYHLVDYRFDVEVDRYNLNFAVYFDRTELARYGTVERVNRAVDLLAIAIANRDAEFTFPADVEAEPSPEPGTLEPPAPTTVDERGPVITRLAETQLDLAIVNARIKEDANLNLPVNYWVAKRHELLAEQETLKAKYSALTAPASVAVKTPDEKLAALYAASEQARKLTAGKLEGAGYETFKAATKAVDDFINDAARKLNEHAPEGYTVMESWTEVALPKFIICDPDGKRMSYGTIAETEAALTALTATHEPSPDFSSPDDNDFIAQDGTIYRVPSGNINATANGTRLLINGVTVAEYLTDEAARVAADYVKDFHDNFGGATSLPFKTFRADDLETMFDDNDRTPQVDRLIIIDDEPEPTPDFDDETKKLEDLRRELQTHYPDQTERLKILDELLLDVQLEKFLREVRDNII